MKDTLFKTLKAPNDRSPSEIYDLIIIGGGPAGLSAALCASRASLRVLLIEKTVLGGEATEACRIDNLIGFPGGILGTNLATQMRQQIAEWPIDHVFEGVDDIQSLEPFKKVVRTDLGGAYSGKAVLVSVGLEPKKIDSKFENRFLGRGVSYCAQGDCDFYRDEDVVVLGGGNCAAYAADYLAQYARSVTLVHSANHIRAVRSLKEKIEANPKITVLWDSEVEEIFGIERVEKIKIRHLLNQDSTWVNAKAVFVYKGRIPPQEILNLDLKKDEHGFIVTDEYMRTNMTGIYAAGDIRAKQIRQIATAISDGMIAAINIERDLLKGGTLK